MGFPPGLLHPSGALLVDDSGLISQAPGLTAFAYANGLKLNNAGQLVTKLGGTVWGYNNGLPVTVDGELCVAYFDAAGAAGGVAPTLNLDFMTPGVLDPLITFTRTTVGTYWDANGNLATAAVNEPRWQRDPATGELLGFLIELQTNNSVANNTMVGAVTGTPGTAPNLWNIDSTGNGLTRTIVGVGVERGIEYIDVRYAGTPIASTPIAFTFYPLSPGVASNQSQLWCPSAFVKLVGGSVSGVVFNICVVGIDSANAFVGDIPQAFVPTNAPLSLQRPFIITNISSLGATATKVYPRMRFDVQAGVPVDFTLRVGLPQFETGHTGASPETPVRTTSAQVVRGFDATRIANISSFYNQGVGTMVAVWSAAGQITGNVWEFSNGIEVVRHRSGINVDSSINSGGVGQATSAVTTGARTQTSPINTTAVTWGPGNGQTLAVVWNGKLGTTPTAALMAVNVNLLAIGATGAGGASPLGGYMRSMTYYPVRLTNDQLVSLTENTFHVGGVLVSNSAVRIINA